MARAIFFLAFASRIVREQQRQKTHFLVRFTLSMIRKICWKCVCAWEEEEAGRREKLFLCSSFVNFIAFLGVLSLSSHFMLCAMRAAVWKNKILHFFIIAHPKCDQLRSKLTPTVIPPTRSGSIKTSEFRFKCESICSCAQSFQPKKWMQLWCD